MVGGAARRSPTAWLRTAALLAYAVLCLLFTLPGGSRFTSRAVWESPHNKKQFAAWAETLTQLGIETSGPGLQKRLWSATKRYSQVRDQIIEPLAWLPVQLGFAQSWRMFSNPQTTPSRLWVEVDVGQGFEPIYVSRSDLHTWRRSFFEHHRLRKLLGRIGRGGKDGAYDALAAWIAKRAFLDHPMAADVRVRVETWSTPTPESPPPWGAAQQQGEFRMERRFARPESFP